MSNHLVTDFEHELMQAYDDLRQTMLMNSYKIDSYGQPDETFRKRIENHFYTFFSRQSIKILGRRIDIEKLIDIEVWSKAPGHVTIRFYDAINGNEIKDIITMYMRLKGERDYEARGSNCSLN